MGVLDFLLGGGQRGRSGPELLIDKEMKTYDQLMDEITAWNIDNTDILTVLRSEVDEKRLATWSHAMEKGVRRGLASTSGKKEDSPLFPIYLDLYQFVKALRQKLLMNPTMKNVRGVDGLDSLAVSIVCGIRALQKEQGAKRLMNTLQWKLLERYLG